MIERQLKMPALVLLGLVRQNPNTAYGAWLAGELSEVIGAEYTNPMIYQTMGRLKGDGYVVSVQRPPFGRRYYSLTPKGEELAALIESVFHSRDDEL